jgi:hypothetical protein
MHPSEEDDAVFLDRWKYRFFDIVRWEIGELAVLFGTCRACYCVVDSRSFDDHLIHRHPNIPVPL